MVKSQTFWITLFIAPCMILYFFIYGIPLFNVIWTSFTDYTTFSKPAFSGLVNYKTLLFHNSDFWAAIKNTLLWVVIQCTINVALGTFVALLLYRKPFGWKFVRTAFMIPNIIPTAATGIMFYLMLNPELGFVKSFYQLFGMQGTPINFFGNGSYSFIGVTIIWLFYSAFNTILIMAEIGAISDSVFESAKIDGANSFQIDWYITLPMLRNILATCVILAAVGMVTQFDTLYVTTRGGPGTSTLNLPMYLFKTATLDNDYGLANAIGVIQIIIGLGLVLLIGRLFKLGQSHE
jgi:raffinose/stachyose/melibiose transport system permease protein